MTFPRWLRATVSLLALVAPRGAAAKTPTLVGDLVPGERPSDPRELTAVSGVLFFTAFDETGKRVLWSSDGTPAGTQGMSTEVGSVGLINEDGLLYYFSSGRPVRIPTGEPEPADDRIFYSRATRAYSPNDFPFWSYPYYGVFVSEGTAETLLAEFPPPCTFTERCQYLEGPHSLRRFNGATFFIDFGVLWKTDGTPAGTSPSAQIPIYETPLGSAQDVEILNDALYFPSGMLADPPTNRPFYTELWKSDGSTVGTSRVATLGKIAATYSYADTVPFDLVRGDNLLFILLPPDQGAAGLWRSDGTAAGTLPVASVDVGSGNVFSAQMTALGHAVLFISSDAEHGRELWRSDGTIAGTVRLSDINPGPGDAKLAHLRAAGGRVFFSASTPETGAELWQSDGSVAGTRFVAEINPGPAGSDPAEFAAIGDRLFFSATESTTGRELWTLDISVCSGDCGYDGAVTVADLVTAVRIALEQETTDSCVPADLNHDGRVGVDEIVHSVNAALAGCSQG